MGYRLEELAAEGETPLSEAGLAGLIEEHEREVVPRLEMLWSYYRNPMELGRGGAGGRVGGRRGGRPRLAQERGLPGRLFGAHGGWGPAGVDEFSRVALGGGASGGAGGRKEIVIENDIAWRVHAMVDFLFGKPVRVRSEARDPGLARRIDAVLDAVWEASGGMTLLADMALLGQVYGYVDLVVRWTGTPWDIAGEVEFDEGRGHEGSGASAELLAAARMARVEVVEPTRGIAVTSAEDYRRLEAYVVRVRRGKSGERSGLRERESGVEKRGVLAWLGEALRPGGSGNGNSPNADGCEIVTEILSAEMRQVYVDSGDGEAKLVDQGPNVVSPGTVPVVHIQNVSQPFVYAGLSEVEGLIPLQDELNTRLSDRANRVTMQSFKMYLAKGIEGFERGGISPGTVWVTDNAAASVEAFGGDAASPSEDAHIGEVRDALDKASGVPPLVTGAVKAKIGNLTSATALRVVLQGLLTRTERKRLTYGRGIAQASALVLAALDRAGVLKTSEEDRRVGIEWADPLGEMDGGVGSAGGVGVAGGAGAD